MTELTRPAERRSLTEPEKIDIIHRHRNGIAPLAISRSMELSESPMHTFSKVYQKHRKVLPRRGRPTVLPPATYIVDAAIDELEANRRLNLQQQILVLTSDDAARMNTTLQRRLRHGHGYHFLKQIEVWDLAKPHKSARVQRCVREITNSKPLPVVFTQESIRSPFPSCSSSSIRSPFRSCVPHRFDYGCQSAVCDLFAVCCLKKVEGSRDDKRDERSMKKEQRKETK
jgi:hypothetical protein